MVGHAAGERRGRQPRGHIARAERDFFCAAEAGRPGHRQRHENTHNTFPTRIYTHKLNSAILGPTGGHRPVRPQGGAARAAPTVGATTSDISRHAASQTREHARHSTQAKRPGARTAPAHPPTPTHPHPCSAQSSAASRTERLPAARGLLPRGRRCSCAPRARGWSVSPCGRSRSSRSHLQLLHVVVRLLLWRADRREASDARRARTRGRVAQRAAGALREGSVRVCTRGTGSAGASFSSSGVSCCGAQS